MQEPITYTMMGIPSGSDGVRATLKMMGRLVNQYKSNRVIRELTLRLTKGLDQKDFVGEAQRIHSFVKNYIRYIKDINGVETLHSPLQLLRLRAGDCDDKSILAASLLEAAGHPTRFVAVGFRPKQFTHVFVETKIGSRWVAVETTEPVDLGWRPRNIKSIMIHHNR